MDISSVKSTSADIYLPKSAQSNSQSPLAQNSATNSSAQEAQETAAVTKAEALKGDQQAVRKIALQAALQNPQSVEPPPVTNTIVNNRLNVTA